MLLLSIIISFFLDANSSGNIRIKILCIYNMTNIKEKLILKLKVIEDYQEYLELINDLSIIKLFVLTKEDCDACKKTINDSNKLLQMYSDKIKIKEVRIYQDSSKNNTSMKIFDNYKIDYVPTYILIHKNNFEKIKDGTFKYLNERITTLLNY